MNRIESFITAHIGDKINECDDNFSVNIANNSFAVADGSSSDFFSNIYARLLADTFVSEGKKMFTEERIRGINSEWRGIVEKKLNEAGCKPGSFPYVRFQKMDPGCSTLIGLHIFDIDEEIKFRCLGLGDSVLFFIPKGEKIPSLQFSSYSNENYTLDQTVEFGYVPIISRSYSTKWIEDIKEVERPLQEGVFYLMTDGLAEWILRRDNGDVSEKFDVLSNIHSQEDFLSYIDDIRSKGAHNDDMTLMKVYIDDLMLSFDSSLDHIYDYRSDIEELEKEELAKRQESAKKEEELARQRASVVANKKNDMDALLAAAKARTAAENQKKEKLEREKREEKNKEVIDSARKKISEDRGKKTEFEDALAKEKEKWGNEQESQIQARIDEAVANAEKKKDEEFAEQLKLRKEEEEKAALETKAKEDEEAEAQIQARIDEAVAAAKKEKDEEFAKQFKLHKEEEEKAVLETKAKEDEEAEAQIQARIDEAVAAAKKEKDEEFAEQLKLRKKEEEKAASETKAKEDEEAEAQIQARIDEAVANAEKKKDEEFVEQLKLRKEEEEKAEKEKKKVKNIIKSNRISLILVVIFMVCAFHFVSQQTKQEIKKEELVRKVDSLYTIHGKDSASLISERNKTKDLGSKYKKALTEIDKLKNEISKKKSTKKKSTKKKKQTTTNSNSSNTNNSNTNNN